jgi:hypothetical protein
MKKKTSSQFYPKAPLSPPPPSVLSTPSINNNQSVTMSNGFFNTMKEGFAFGIGSSVARQAINSIFSTSTSSTSTTPNLSNECDFIQDMYKKCIARTDGDCVEIIKEFNKKCGIGYTSK